MKSKLLNRDGVTFLRFRPKGYLHSIELPVMQSGSRDKSNFWTWNGDISQPTLRPSVKTLHGGGLVSHFWLNDGMCLYLSDSTDGNAGKSLPLIDIE